METGTAQEKITLAFINDKSPILDLICDDLITYGIDVLFRSESVKEGISQLFSLKEFPETCIIDLDFHNKNILKQLQKFRSEYPSIKLIAHSDIDDKKVAEDLSKIGFAGYLFIGSDPGGFAKAINKAVNG